MNRGLPSLLKVLELFFSVSLRRCQSDRQRFVLCKRSRNALVQLFVLMLGTSKSETKKTVEWKCFRKNFFFIERDKQGLPFAATEHKTGKKTFHLWIFYCLYVSVSLKATLNHIFYWRLVEARFSFKLIIKHARFSHQRESLFALIPQLPSQHTKNKRVVVWLPWIIDWYKELYFLLISKILITK